MQNKKGFTLVELIVVITILAILWTIAFISLQWYSSEARDSKRVTDLWQIRTGIQLYQAKEWVVPEPSETKTLIWSWTTNLIVQWYAWTWVLNNIRVNNDVKDPLEDIYYTYSTNWVKTKFQLLALLENQETAYNVIPKTYANYETRDLYSVWDKLWILLDSTTNIPIQELGETELDLSTNSTEYKAVFTSNDIQTFSWITLYKKYLNLPLSCKEILDNNKSRWDWVYSIYPWNNIDPLDVYCDMTTDWGGWTLIANVNWDPSLINSSEWLWNIYDINANFAKVSNSDLNKLILNNKLRFQDIENWENWIIEYQDWQELYFDRFQSYTIRLENPLTNRTSPWYINHPHFILFSWITRDLPLPAWCTRSYERINYSIYLEAEGRYASLCSDSIPQWWSPYIHRTSSVPNNRWHSKTFKLWVK